MTTTSTGSIPLLAEPDWHVLVLHDGQEKDILGIWGPYRGDHTARRALDELQTWPIDGQWSVLPCKQFAPARLNDPTPPPYTVTYTNTGEPIRGGHLWDRPQ